LRVAYEAEESYFGDHVGTVDACHYLAASLYENGNYKESLPLFEKSVEGYKKFTSNENYLVSKDYLALNYERVDRAEEAIKIYDELIKYFSEKYGAESDKVISYYTKLANMYWSLS